MGGFIVNDDMFGAYVKIPTDASRDMHVYKVIGRIESNGYCDVPIMGGEKSTWHSEIVPVLNVVHCGVCEDTVVRVALSDCEIIAPPNEPLTLEELRKMDGEPVWVTYGDCWKICYGLTDYRGYLCMETGDGSCICMDRYGKDWWAYRHKPEGRGQHDAL